MSGIDKYAYQSKISDIKAAHKLLFAVVMMLVCLISGSPVISALTIAAMSAATLLLGGYRLKKYLGLLLVPLSFLLTGVLTIVVNQLNDVDAAIVAVRLFGGVYGISPDSLKTGFNIFLRAFGSVTCLYFFSLNTPMNSFLSFFRRRAPGMLVELMELMYRFIFIVWDEAGKIHTAQASRLGYSGFANSLKSLGELVTNVFIRAFRRVDRISIALEARGFEGNFDYLIEEERSSRLLSVYASAAVAMTVAAAIIERLYS